MNELIYRIGLFVSSYAPLFVVGGLKHWPDAKCPQYVSLRQFSSDIFYIYGVSIGFFGAALVFASFAAWYIKQRSNQNRIRIKAMSVNRKDADNLAYVVTYIFPFLDIKELSLLFLFIVIAVIYISSNMIYTNPVLNLLGYRIYEVTDEDGKIVSLISKRHYIPTKDIILAASISDYIALDT